MGRGQRHNAATSVAAGAQVRGLLRQSSAATPSWVNAPRPLTGAERQVFELGFTIGAEVNATVNHFNVDILIGDRCDLAEHNLHTGRFRLVPHTNDDVPDLHLTATQLLDGFHPAT